MYRYPIPGHTTPKIRNCSAVIQSTMHSLSSLHWMNNIPPCYQHKDSQLLVQCTESFWNLVNLTAAPPLWADACHVVTRCAQSCKPILGTYTAERRDLLGFVSRDFQNSKVIFLKARTSFQRSPLCNLCELYCAHYCDQYSMTPSRFSSGRTCLSIDSIDASHWSRTLEQKRDL